MRQNFKIFTAIKLFTVSLKGYGQNLNDNPRVEVLDSLVVQVHNSFKEIQVNFKYLFFKQCNSSDNIFMLRNLLNIKLFISSLMIFYILYSFFVVICIRINLKY